MTDKLEPCRDCLQNCLHDCPSNLNKCPYKPLEIRPADKQHDAALAGEARKKALQDADFAAQNVQALFLYYNEDGHKEELAKYDNLPEPMTLAWLMRMANEMRDAVRNLIDKE